MLIRTHDNSQNVSQTNMVHMCIILISVFSPFSVTYINHCVVHTGLYLVLKWNFLETMLLPSHLEMSLYGEYFTISRVKLSFPEKLSLGDLPFYFHFLNLYTQRGGFQLNLESSDLLYPLIQPGASDFTLLFNSYSLANSTFVSVCNSLRFQKGGFSILWDGFYWLAPICKSSQGGKLLNATLFWGVNC